MGSEQRLMRRLIENHRLVFDCEGQVRKQAAGLDIASFLFVVSFSSKFDRTRKEP